MMHITFAPMRRDDQLTVSAVGDCLTVNGVTLDFSAIPEGGMQGVAEPGNDWLASDVARRDGVLHLTLILPHGPRAPEQTLFPAPVTVLADGPVLVPPYALPPYALPPDALAPNALAEHVGADPA